MKVTSRNSMQCQQMLRKRQLLAMCSSIIVSIILKRRRGRRRNRKVWTRKWILNRQQQGAYNNLMQELRLGDSAAYANFVRMDIESFNELLDLVGPTITKKDTKLRKAIPAGERLALSLRYLATGESYKSLEFLYRIPSQTIGKIVPEVCMAIKEALQPYIKVPQTPEEWEAIAKTFEEKWNFPNCLGALDGKHVMIRPPPGSGSYFFNYKHTFSTVLLALVDADYKFLYVDIGTNGRVADGGVYKNSELAKALESGELNIPKPATLERGYKEVPYVIVADDAFPLKENIMKPFGLRNLTKEQRVFNYRLSRARRIVENAFGILSNRFRVFMAPIPLSPEKIECIVMAACALHNYLRSKVEARNTYTPLGLTDIEDQHSHSILPGRWRAQPNSQGLVELAQQGSNRCSTNATCIRQEFCRFFNSTEGEVEWQWDKI